MKKTATFRFYAELNDFLPVSKRQKPFFYEFNGKPSVKDAIESLGVPHTEVDLLIVNSTPENLKYNLNDKDIVSVYPVFESMDISSLISKNKKPLRNLKFIADVNLGKLSKYLRLLGFDTLYSNNYEDSEIILISMKQGRIILTKDKELLKNSNVDKGYYVRSFNPKEQIKELVRRFDLYSSIHPLARCIKCNGIIEKVPKDEIMDKLLPRTQIYFDIFYKCTSCGQIYWQGSHYEKMMQWIYSIKKEHES